MNKCTMIMRSAFVLIAFALAGLSTHKLLGKTEAKATGPTKQFTKYLKRDRYLLLVVSRIIKSTDTAKSGRLDHGAIGLQIHDKGMQVEFKDIRLKQPETKGGIRHVNSDMH